ncbi:hypothetical protein SVIOM74S_09480 [Streptomyces violarus]
MGDLVEILVTGAFGRLDLLVPILLAVIAVRFIRHPEKPEANGRIVIGLSALLIGVLGQVHIACGSPARGEGMQAIRDAGGLIGWAMATPLSYAMGDMLAVPLLVLLTIFGLLVVTATPVNAIPQRLRLLGVRLGIVRDPADDEFGEDDERYDEQWREALPARPRGRRAPEPTAYDPDSAEQEALSRRRGRPRRSAVPQPDMDRPRDAVDVAAAAAAALDGAVLHGMPPSPIVADLTQGVTVGDREPTTPTPVPAARPQQEKVEQDQPEQEKPKAGVRDLTKSPPAKPRDLPPRAEQLQLSGDITYALPSLDLLTRGGPGKARSAANDAIVALARQPRGLKPDPSDSAIAAAPQDKVTVQVGRRRQELDLRQGPQRPTAVRRTAQAGRVQDLPGQRQGRPFCIGDAGAIELYVNGEKNENDFQPGAVERLTYTKGDPQVG